MIIVVPDLIQRSSGISWISTVAGIVDLSLYCSAMQTKYLVIHQGIKKIVKVHKGQRQDIIVKNLAKTKCMIKSHIPKEKYFIGCD